MSRERRTPAWRRSGPLEPVTLLAVPVALLLVMATVAGCLSRGGSVGEQDMREDADGTDRGADDGAAGSGRWVTPAERIKFDGIRQPVAVLPELKLATGEVRYFDGVVGVRTSVPALLGAQVRCSKGENTWASAYSTRNTSNEPGHVDVLRSRWMFQAPADGTYRCALYAHADHKKRPDNYTMRVRPEQTRLDMADDPIASGLRWVVEHDVEVGRPSQKGLLRKGFEAVSTAREIDVRADIEVTANYEGRRYDYDSEVLVNLTVEQLDDSGRPCGQSWSMSGRQRVTREVHHAKVRADLPDVPVRTERTCTRQFAATVNVELAKGAPITVHGKEYSDLTVLMRDNVGES